MATVLTNARLLVDGAIRDGLDVAVEGGTIVAVGAGLAGETLDLGGGLLAPGFIDTQVNGGGGVLFNDEPTPEGIAAIGAAHRRFGTTGFLPTLISDDLDVIARAIDATAEAIARGVPGVLGLHIEGPFLNAARKGVHDASKFRTLDDAAVELLSRPTDGVTLVTLAPETTDPATISALAARGVVIAAGHTDATYAQTKAALEAGVTGFTHLFNAMSPLSHRAPGAVGAALESRTAWCGLIVDGLHVDPVVLKLALRCRPLDRFMLVTDAMPGVGHDQSWFTLQGKRIEVRDGVCVDPNGTLAGSHLDMAGAVRNAMAMMDLTEVEALEMAAASPAAFLGMADRRGRIAPGQAADLVLLDETMTVTRSWIAGREA